MIGPCSKKSHKINHLRSHHITEKTLLFKLVRSFNHTRFCNAIWARVFQQSGDYCGLDDATRSLCPGASSPGADKLVSCGTQPFVDMQLLEIARPAASRQFPDLRCPGHCRIWEPLRAVKSLGYRAASAVSDRPRAAEPALFT